MLKKLIFIVMLLLVSTTLASADTRSGKGSCIFCHPNGPPPGTLTCGSCHINPPPTNAHLVHTDGVGAVYGSDANNSAAAAYRFNCANCHPTSGTLHGDNLVEVELYNAAATGMKRLNPSGGRSGTGGATVCSNIYCHSGGQPTGTIYASTPSWGGNFSGNRCGGCHGYPPSYANNSPKANSHPAHPASCNVCHAGTTSDGSTINNRALHVNGALDVTPGSSVSFSYSYAATGGTCSNISCHAGNTATWGTTLGCYGCHGDQNTMPPPHAKHVNPVTGKGYACDTCHANTVSGSSTIINPALHGNNVVDVAGAFSFNSSTKSCSVSCHLSATPVWTSTATGACGTCHAALSGTAGGAIATNAHPAHLGGVYGPKLDPAVVTGSCAIFCHSYSTDTAPTHVNGSVDLGAGYSKNGTCSTCHQQGVNWSGGQISCESCHTPPLSVIGGLTAPDKSQASFLGHGKAGIDQGCTACHNRDSAHIFATVSSAKRLLPALTGSANAECRYCHDDALKIKDAPFRNMSTHFISKGGTQAMACAKCHDPHGTTNLSQIRTLINGQTISYTDRLTGWVDTTNNNGLCQACHTQTAHYTLGHTESSHPSSNCFSCHRHNAAGGAFKPNGNCDSCHGYPPVPRQFLTQVRFGFTGAWSSARFEDYSGGGGAHLVAQHLSPNAKPSEGWANCAVCHNAGVTNNAPNHKMVLPLKAHVSNVTIQVDPQYRFNNSFIVYTGAKLVDPPATNATGSCFNVSCHMSQTPRWSLER